MQVLENSEWFQSSKIFIQLSKLKSKSSYPIPIFKFPFLVHVILFSNSKNMNSSLIFLFLQKPHVWFDKILEFNIHMM